MGASNLYLQMKIFEDTDFRNKALKVFSNNYPKEISRYSPI